MRELWGSITTEEQTQRCRRMAVLSNFISNININIISLIFGELVFLLSCFPQSAYPGCLSSCSSVVYLGTLHRHKTKISSCYAALSSTFIIKQALTTVMSIMETAQIKGRIMYWSAAPDSLMVSYPHDVGNTVPNMMHCQNSICQQSLLQSYPKWSIKP